MLTDRKLKHQHQVLTQVKLYETKLSLNICLASTLNALHKKWKYQMGC
jgi:hypothetical protein